MALGRSSLNATFGNNGAEISGKANNFTIISIDNETNENEVLADVEGELSISGSITAADAGTLAVSGDLSGEYDGTAYNANISGDIEARFIEDVDGDEMIRGAGEITIDTDYPNFADLENEDNAFLTATKDK